MKNCVNTIKKACSLMLAAVFLTALFIWNAPVAAYADSANVSMSASKSNCTVGDEITVTIKVTGDAEIFMCDLYVTYDKSVLELISGHSNKFDGGFRILSTDATTFEVKFKAVGVGSSSISLNKDSSIISSINEDYVAISASGTSVNVSAPVTYSSENRLSSLSISPGVLSPAFSEGVTSYTTSVNEDVEKLVVSAKPKDSKAKVSVSGTSLSKGTNTVKITVTAENGSKKTYTIKVTRAGEASTDETEEQTTAPEEKKVTVNGIEYDVVNDLSQHPLPEGFEQTTTDIDGVSVTAGRGVNSNLTLVYLESTDTNAVAGFYIYDTVTKTFTVYNEISLPGFRYVILPITDGMEPPLNWDRKEAVIDDKNVTVLMHESGNFCVFYGIDSNGKSDWYYYDCTDKTVMRYFDIFEDDLAKADEETSVKPADNTKYIVVIAVVGAVAVISAILAIVFALSAKKNKKAFNAAVQGNDTDEDAVDDISYDDGDVLSDDYEEQDEFNLDEEYYDESDADNSYDTDLLNEAEEVSEFNLDILDENDNGLDIDILEDSRGKRDIDILNEEEEKLDIDILNEEEEKLDIDILNEEEENLDIDILEDSDEKSDINILDESDDNELELFDVDDK